MSEKNTKKVIFQHPLALPASIKFSIGRGEGGKGSPEGGGMGEAKNEPPAAPSPLALHVGKII